jgi:hypothetical protein
MCLCGRLVALSRTTEAPSAAAGLAALVARDLPGSTVATALTGAVRQPSPPAG